MNLNKSEKILTVITFELKVITLEWMPLKTRKMLLLNECFPTRCGNCFSDLVAWCSMDFNGSGIVEIWVKLGCFIGIRNNWIGT